MAPTSSTDISCGSSAPPPTESPENFAGLDSSSASLGRTASPKIDLAGAGYWACIGACLAAIVLGSLPLALLSMVFVVVLVGLQDGIEG